MQLEDKIALVTGAGRGMGRAISLQLAEEGANVAVSDIDASTAEDTAVAIKQLGRESVVLPADMGDLNDINRMFTQAKDAFGRLDVVVNNAGVTKYLDIMDVQEEDWDRIHRVNAKGVFFCMQRAARELIGQGQGGRIINIASIAGKGYAGTSNAAYAASKGAVISMTRIAALQLGQYDINVNAICPGSTLTTMAADTMSGRSEQTGQSMQELEQARDAKIPIGRPTTQKTSLPWRCSWLGPAAGTSPVRRSTSTADW